MPRLSFKAAYSASVLTFHGLIYHSLLGETNYGKSTDFDY